MNSQGLLSPALSFSLYGLSPASDNPTATPAFYRLDFFPVSYSPHPFLLGRWANCSAATQQHPFTNRYILQKINNMSHYNRAKGLHENNFFFTSHKYPSFFTLHFPTSQIPCFQAAWYLPGWYRLGLSFTTPAVDSEWCIPSKIQPSSLD